MRFHERRVNASFLGNQRFVAKDGALAVYLRFLGAFAGFVVLAVAVFGVLDVPERDSLALLFACDPSQFRSRSERSCCRCYCLPGAGGARRALISCGYTAACYRHAMGHTTRGRCASAAT